MASSLRLESIRLIHAAIQIDIAIFCCSNSGVVSGIGAAAPVLSDPSTTSAGNVGITASWCLNSGVVSGIGSPAPVPAAPVALSTSILPWAKTSGLMTIFRCTLATG